VLNLTLVMYMIRYL